MVKALTPTQALDIVPFSHELRSRMLSALTDSQLGLGMHIVTTSGEIHTGPEASTRLLAAMVPQLRGFLSSERAGSAPQAWLRRGYTAVSANRSHLARIVPNVDPICRIHE